MEGLKKKYGLLTGIAMVVGIVIGSGVFFKAHRVLVNTNGKLGLALFAWLIGGLIMVISAYCFSQLATKIEKVNGVVDYVEAATNKKVAYFTGWYFTTVYYPILISILAFLSVNYFFVLIGQGALIVVSWIFWVAVALTITAAFAMNTLAPKIAGHFQVSTTFIKMIPIIIIAIVGTVVGLINGNTSLAFASLGNNAIVKNDFGSALLATIFAYEGWIVATSINAELTDSKKNLPIALLIGTLIVIAAYLLYYLGLSSIIPNTNDIIQLQNNAPIVAIGTLLGPIGEVLFNIFLIISCLGTLNGLTMGGSRGFYSLAVRQQGPRPEVFRKLHEKTNTSIASSVVGYVLAIAFMGLWIVSMLTSFNYLGTMDELSIAFIYAVYIAVYVWMIKTGKNLNIFNRYIMPILAILCALLLVFAATGLFKFVSTGDTYSIISFAVFLGLAAISLLIGAFFYKKETN
ncbi:MAG: amino acid permease [Bacilli bacterium]